MCTLIHRQMPGRSISQADTLRDELGGELNQFLNREFNTPTCTNANLSMCCYNSKG